MRGSKAKLLRSYATSRAVYRGLKKVYKGLPKTEQPLFLRELERKHG